MDKLRNWVIALAIVFTATLGAETPLGIRCYNTNYGLLQFVFVPPKVVAIYTYAGGGVVVGDLSGNKLKAVWNEPNATEYETTGDAEFEFSGDWKTFQGRYKYAHGDNWYNWTGLLTRCTEKDPEPEIIPKQTPRSSPSTGHEHHHH